MCKTVLFYCTLHLGTSWLSMKRCMLAVDRACRLPNSLRWVIFDKCTYVIAPETYTK